MLHVENLGLRFNQTQILDDVSLHVRPGEIVGLIGPNGCGKTTLLNALSGFARPHRGLINLHGKEISKLSPSQRAAHGLGRSFQSAGVFKDMTLEENLLVALETVQKLPWWWKFSRTHRSKADREVHELLKSVGIENKKHELAGMLSGGQLRLLELLRLQVNGGSLLLIDEPTAGVSPVMKQILANQLRALSRKDRSMIIVEHDLKFLFDLVDRVIVLVEGNVFLEGSPKDVVENPKLKEVYFGTR